ncbi:MAG: hypothetical protein ABTQ34_07285 [Bdellovibrionales bacterium]
MAHYSFPNGHGVIVEEDTAKRYSLLPLEFGANGRLETLSRATWGKIAEAGFRDAKQMENLNRERAAQLILLVSSLTPSRNAPYKPPVDGSPRWRELNPLALTT